MYGEWNNDLLGETSAITEAMVVLIAVINAPLNFEQKAVRVYSDSKTVIKMLEELETFRKLNAGFPAKPSDIGKKNTEVSFALLHIMRTIFLVAERKGMTLRKEYIPGDSNEAHFLSHPRPPDKIQAYAKDKRQRVIEKICFLPSTL